MVGHTNGTECSPRGHLGPPHLVSWFSFAITRSHALSARPRMGGGRESNRECIVLHNALMCKSIEVFGIRKYVVCGKIRCILCLPHAFTNYVREDKACDSVKTRRGAHNVTHDIGILDNVSCWDWRICILKNCIFFRRSFTSNVRILYKGKRGLISF